MCAPPRPRNLGCAWQGQRGRIVKASWVLVMNKTMENIWKMKIESRKKEKIMRFYMVLQYSEK
jgi:hypothetical protein